MKEYMDMAKVKVDWDKLASVPNTQEDDNKLENLLWFGSSFSWASTWGIKHEMILAFSCDQKKKLLLLE